MIEQASLVLGNGNWAVKSDSLLGYKTIDGKYYSREMTVSRATTATRVNAAGLVENVPYNLFTYSQQFDNSNWTKNNATVTGGQSGYDGSSNAFLLIDDSANDVHLVRQTPIVSGQYTISVYAKANTLNFVWLRGVQSSVNVRAWFNLSTGTVGTVETNGTATIESVGNGWYRCSLTIANFQSGFESYIGASNANGAFSYVGSGQSIYIQNAQANEGTLKDYLPTTTRLNIARVDYSTGSPALLVEPQRTNLNLNSEQLASQSLQSSPLITSNTAVSPNGTINADKLTPTVNATYTGVVRTSVAAGTYTISMFAKADGKEWVFFYNIGGSSGPNGVWYNVSTGVIGTVGASWTNAKIENYGNGWYRVSATITFPSNGSTLYYLVSDANGNPLLSVNGTDGMLMWGFQVEVGAYATSYIPTTSASVTRNVDIVSKTGISSLIGQTEGTILIDFVLKNPISATNRMVSLTESNWSSGGSIYFNATASEFNVDIVNAGSSVASIGYPFTPQQNTRYKIAVAYKLNDCKMYVNGVDAGSDTSTSAMPTCSELYLNALGGGFNAPYEATAFNSVALFKTRLTNAELAELTTI